MDNFIPIRFRTSVQLAPSELNVEFQHAILAKLRGNLEGLCTRFGYIRPNSIVKRSAGQFVKQHFNGHIRFDLVCRAEVCNPAQGLVVKATVRVKNEMGILAESSIDIDGKKLPVLDIIVPLRAAGITSDINLDEVNVGDEIYVCVLSKRYQLRDKKISVIGKAVREPGSVVVAESGAVAGLDDDIDKSSVGSFEDEDDLEEDVEETAEGASDDESQKRGGVATKTVFIQEEEEADEEEVQEEEVDDDLLYGGDDDAEDFYENGKEDFDDFADYE